MAPRPCQVCNADQSKYKCPSCLIPYCSLPCYKKHKEVPCANARSSNTIISFEETQSLKAPTPVAQQRLFEVDDQSWVLQKNQLETIVFSKEILEALKDKELQKLICGIDQSTDAENELGKALQGETFRLFTNKILSVVNPP